MSLYTAELYSTEANKDFSTTLSIAQLIILILVGESTRSKDVLLAGFRREAARIRKIGNLLEKWSIDTIAPIFLGLIELRQCYDSYSFLLEAADSHTASKSHTIEGRQLDLSRLDSPMLKTWTTSHAPAFSPPKLQQLLQKSRHCTNHLLEYPLTQSLPALIEDGRIEKSSTTQLSVTQHQDTTTSAPKQCFELAMNTCLSRVAFDQRSYGIVTLGDELNKFTIFVERKRNCSKCDKGSSAYEHKSLQRLGKSLRRLGLEDSIGLLQLLSFTLEHAEGGAYLFVYRMPARLEFAGPRIKSLRECMESKSVGIQPSFIQRQAAAKRICCALLSLHSEKILHKNIQKESVIFFCTEVDAEVVWGEP
jgi:hypothetical protein